MGVQSSRGYNLADYLAAVAVPEGQKVFWMTDNDALVPSAQLGHLVKHRGIIKTLCGATCQAYG